jgi:hypothetical protein
MRRGIEAVGVAALAALGAGCQVEPGGTAAAAAAGDAFEEEQQAGVARNPEGVSFKIRIAAERAVFHQGERIPVELSFSSSVPERYLVDLAQYDRSGRLSSDTYCVAPAGGATDPLRDYFDDGIFIGGGMRSVPVLGEEPQTLVFDVNEWLRFDAPGLYRLYVRSDRIERENEASEALAIDHGVATSDMVSFEVLPDDPDWSALEARRATSALDGEESPATEQERREAARTLRFLGTTEAAREMAERFRGNRRFDFDLDLGLIASPHREEVVSLLEERLDAPDFPVSSPLLSTLVLLRNKLDHPQSRGRYPTDDAAAQKRWIAVSEEARAAREATLARYTERLAARLDHKTGFARASSLATLMEEVNMRIGSRSYGPPPAWYPRVVEQLPRVFPDLREETQSSLLRGRWRRIAGPAMIPVLSRLAGEAAPTPDLRALALRRLFELAPEEGRERILAYLRAPGLPLGYEAFPTLAGLPDATLPDVDDALAGRFERCAAGPCADDYALVVKLLARYATPAVADRVWDAWAASPGHWDPAVGAGLLAYLTRVDPSRAALVAQGEVARHRQLGQVYFLRQAAEVRMGPTIERALIAALDDRDANVAADAATVLGRHGSAAALPYLFRRLERWSATWRGRAGDLRRRFSRQSPNEGDIQLEYALRVAIADGAGWVCDGAALEKLEALLVTKQEKEAVAFPRSYWTSGRLGLSLEPYDDGTIHGTVAQYRPDSLDEVKRKIAQFPPGTRFVWMTPDQPPEAAGVEAFVTEHGMAVEPAAP